MMKVALIPPGPDLQRFATTGTHLILAQELDEVEYHDFYKYCGGYRILDNGADEREYGLPVSTLLDLAQGINLVNEIVLPDVQQDGDATFEATREAMTWLVRGGRDAYADAQFPQLMIVPQGKDRDEWRTCLARLLELRVGQRNVWGHSTPVIGIAKNHDALCEGGILRLCGDVPPDFTIHLLGWPRDLIAVSDIALEHRNVRSIDTARPFVYAKHGILLDHTDGEVPKYPGRDDDYFYEAIPADYRGIAEHNVNVFRTRALDFDA